MWIGFRKRLGKGFSIGVGKRVSMSGGKKRVGHGARGLTQAETAKLEKLEFLQKIANDANSYYRALLANYNVDVAQLEASGLTVHDHFEGLNKLDEYQQAENVMNEIKPILERIQYGSPLTAKRREQLIDLVFKLKEMASIRPVIQPATEAQEHQQAQTAHGYTQPQAAHSYTQTPTNTLTTLKSRRLNVYIAMVLLMFVMGLLAVESGSDYFALTITAPLMGGILWLPYYIISKILERNRSKS